MSAHYSFQRNPTGAFGAALFALVVLTTLAGCSGGGDSGGATNPPPPPPPPPTRTAETLVYVADDGVSVNGGEELYAVDDDGGNPVRLSHAMAQAATDIPDFALSPDGQWVAWTADVDGLGGHALFVNSISGGTPIQVSQSTTNPGRRVKSFDWSPDSTRLAFAGNFDVPITLGYNANEVWIVDRDGSNLTKINGNIGRPVTVEVKNPQWSPDGRYIVQEVSRFDPSSNSATSNAIALNLFDTSPGTANSIRLVTVASRLANVRWSPNGQRISYTADQNVANQYHVYTINVDGSGNVRVTSNGDFNSDSRWSPDSTELSYLDHPSAPFPQDLIVSAGTAGATDRILAFLSPDGRGVRQFEWSPNGQSIAFIGNVNDDLIFELFVVPADGTAPPARVSPALSGSADILDFAWAPDSQRLAYVADSLSDTVRDLFVISAGGSGNVHLSGSLAGEEVDEFAWSNDGEQVIFSVGPESRTVSADTIYAVSPAGGGRVEVSDGPFDGSIRFKNR